MKPFTMFLVAATLVTAVSATAQDRPGRRSVREGIVATRSGDPDRVQARQTARGPTRNDSRATPQVSRRAGHSTSRYDPRRGSRVTVSHSPGYRAPVLRAPIRHHARGHYETICEPVLVAAGHWHVEYVQPSCGWIYDDCGRRQWGVIDPGGNRRIWHDAVYENRSRRVWVAY